MRIKEGELRSEALQAPSSKLRPEMENAAGRRRVYLAAEVMFVLLTINAIANLLTQSREDGMIDGGLNVVMTATATYLLDDSAKKYGRIAKVYREVIESRPKEFQ